ncbi:MAG: HEAT repeat domain-containing protein [Planctomycetota bacterium]|nr:HEAT repeat domain-containing protein [Planctomycetota bacterium]
MRCALVVAVVLVAACKSKPERTMLLVTPLPKLPRELAERESTKLVRATNRNIIQWHDLKYGQGATSAAIAMHHTIRIAVDENFDMFIDVARNGELLQLKSMAVKAIGFTSEHRRRAREFLKEELDNESWTIVANAALGLGILRSKKTDEEDLGALISLLENKHAPVRANSADALGNLFTIKPTPVPLTPQYETALNRLTILAEQRGETRVRRASIKALIGMHTPGALMAFAEGLDDPDFEVRIGCITGMRLLLDPRAIDPLVTHLEDIDSKQEATHVTEALIKIAMVQNFSGDARELEALGTSYKQWRNFIRSKRMELG